MSSPSYSQPLASVLKPPERLGEVGRALWHELQSDYHIADIASLIVLGQACMALDRAEALGRRIDLDGEVIDTPSGPKPHPALAAEQQARALGCRLLRTLGLVFEPLLPVGRHYPDRIRRARDGD
jgi:hypothetical protein